MSSIPLHIRLEDGLGLAVPISLEAHRAVGHGAVLWDAALVLAHAVATRPEFCSSCRGARVLEVGAGLGLPSLAALLAAGAAHVTITDRAAFTALVERNLALNRVTVERGCFLPYEFGGRLRRLAPNQRRLAADSDAPASLPRDRAEPFFDVLLLSDVLGCADEAAFIGLVKTVNDVLSANPRAAVLMSYRLRADWEANFFRCAEEGGLRCTPVFSMTGVEVSSLRQAAFEGAQLELLDGAIEQAHYSGVGPSVVIFQIQRAAENSSAVATQ